MLVSDYYNDMILHQKWAVEVETVVHHSSSGSVEIFVNTFHFCVPILGKCRYLSFPVRYFRVAHDEIILCVNDIIEV